MKLIFRSKVARNLVISFLIVLAPMALMFKAVTAHTINTLAEAKKSAYKYDIHYLTSQVGQEMSSISLLCISLSMDQEIAVLNYQPNDPVKSLLEYRKLLGRLEFCSTSHQLEPDIIVYLQNKRLSFSSQHGMSREIERKTPDAPEAALQFPVWRINEDEAGKRVLEYDVNHSYTAKDSVRVIAQIQADSLLAQLKTLCEMRNVQAAIFDRNGNAVAALGSHINLPSILKDIQVEHSDGEHAWVLDGLLYRFLYHEIPGTGLMMGILYSETEAMKPVNDINRFFIMITFFALIISCGFMLYTYRSLVLPIRQLATAMDELEHGDLHVRIRRKSRNEFDIVNNQFNSMAKRIQTLVEEVYIEKINQQAAQLKLMQAQMNPHFFYNSLNFISQMCHSENNEIAEKMARYMAEYYRYAAKANKDTVSLGQEIDSLEAYMKIQGMRFPERFCYHIDIAEEHKLAQIPRLTVQPFVENAFKHGLANMEEQGRILLSATKEENRLIITVEDNGLGIEPDTLQKIKEQMRNNQWGDDGFGIANTHWRLQFKYGEAAGIQVERLNKGLRIIISLPYITEACDGSAKE